MSVRVSVTGVDGTLGPRVLDRLRFVAEVGDDGPLDVVVHLGAAEYDTLAARRESATTGVGEMLERATRAGAGHVVLVSSAMVYGAYANNPVPLTEDAILRPDVDFVYARQLAAVETLVDRWRRAEPGRTATVLRPVVAMAADGTSRLAAALAAGMGQRFGAADPPAQFLHLDDLAAAVVLAVERRLDGDFNVSPDGWIDGERVRALAGARPRVKLPDRIAKSVAALGWRFRRGPIPPGLWSYTRTPWVVANDRLKREGWHPTVTNEQVYVEGTGDKWWTMISPKRRQELTLGLSAAGVLLGSLSALILYRRWRSRSASPDR